MKVMSIMPIYVTFIPPLKEMRKAELYISCEYSTASHLCCCGCGREVVTPLNPAKWSLSFQDGRVTMCPSIGSWQLPCKSHYFFKDNLVVWMPEYSQEEIRDVQRIDDMAVKNYFAERINGLEQKDIRCRMMRLIRAIVGRFYK